MAEEQSKESVLGGLRSRLPKFSSKGSAAESAEAVVAENEPDVAASATPAVPDAVSPTDSESTQVTPDALQSASQEVETEVPPVMANKNDVAGNGQAKESGAVNEPSVEEVHLQHLQYLVDEFADVQNEMQRMYRLVEEIAERESAQEKVFNTLHAELRDYKNDFIYEHLKPVVRPLLFLYDSLEQFDAEIALYERPSNGERRQSGLSPQLVRENIAFFRDQLVEALRICEVTPMEAPKGAFNARLHKVIDVVPVEASQDGIVQRVVRSGWYLNGALLRSAEVIVGKKMA
jgi:molecular chaperone GrpE (heat shock protein)